MIYIYPRSQKNLLIIPEEIPCIGFSKHNYEFFSVGENKDYVLENCNSCGLIRLDTRNNFIVEDFRDYIASVDFEKLVDKAIVDRKIGLLRLVCTG